MKYLFTYIFFFYNFSVLITSQVDVTNTDVLWRDTPDFKTFCLDLKNQIQSQEKAINNITTILQNLYHGTIVNSQEKVAQDLTLCRTQLISAQQQIIDTGINVKGPRRCGEVSGLQVLTERLNSFIESEAVTKQENTKLQLSLMDLKIENKKLENDFQNLTWETEKLKKNHLDLNVEYKDLRNNVANLNAKKFELQEINYELNLTLVNLTINLSDLTQENSNMQQLNENLKLNASNLEFEIQNLTLKIKELRESNLNLTTVNEVLNQNVSNLNLKSEVLEKDNDRLNMTIKNLEVNVFNLGQENKILTSYARRVEDELHLNRVNLQKQILKLREEENDLRQKYDVANLIKNKKIEDLEKEMEELKVKAKEDSQIANCLNRFKDEDIKTKDLASSTNVVALFVELLRREREIIRAMKLEETHGENALQFAIANNKSMDLIRLLQQRANISDVRCLIQNAQKVQRPDVVEFLKPFFIKEIGEEDVTLTQLSSQLYYFADFELNWSKSRDFCLRHNMQLLSVETMEEHLLLQDHFSKHHQPYKYYWTSGSDNAKEGHWVWTSTNTTIQLPLYIKTRTEKGYNFLYLAYLDSTLSSHEHHIFHDFRFICELGPSCQQ